MTKNENPKLNLEEQIDRTVEVVEEMQLDDARRVKVQSPGMLVFRRFIRNKLAVIGLIILFFMFSFSFLGTVLTPYDQAEVFKGLGSLSKDFAGAIFNTELRYTVVDGESFESAERAQFLFALGNNEETFSYEGKGYLSILEGEGFYRIIQLDPVAEIVLGGFNSIEGVEVPESLGEAYQEAKDRDLKYFELEGVTYHITKNKKVTQVSTEHDIALAMINIYDAYDEADFKNVSDYEFKLTSSRALLQNQNEFSVGDQAYSIRNDEGKITIIDDEGIEFAEVSDIIVNPLDQSLFLSVDFKSAVRGTIISQTDRFTYMHDDGEEVTYTIERVNNTYNIKKDTQTLLIRMYEFSSGDHPMGLDNNGMDVMTRLMYGGQVSLMVGFVVIFIEVFIGIFVGGISGYFGGWVDTALMRFVDLFNSIPFWPMVLILASVMDTMEVEPTARIFFLMIMLGLLGWTGVARIVRGQILSLRELDFMVATEATGIRTGRRIFRHLIPNIMPLLIVYATAGLGGIIITEATLGFLGLGVKYPLASWGSIINVASDAYVMTNFWFMWIPAGTLILLTVLGFNFVGDGLRDAYDPKMKKVGDFMTNEKRSIFDRIKLGTKPKDSQHISARELSRIARENRKITDEIERQRDQRNVPESEYLTRMKNPENVVEFDNLHTYFFTDIGTVKAVDGVSFEVPQGKTVGVVGESGCGKSVTALSLMQLVQRPQGQIIEGTIRFNTGEKVYDIAKTPGEIMETIRGGKVSMIFQEPMTSLNPVFKSGDQIDEVIQLHHPEMAEEEVKALSIEMIDLVGIANSAGVYDMYPHELSGGMRQRVMIAMALACNPKLIIADEPTTALDVTIQAQILDLLRNLKDKINSSIMLITHDLGVIAEMADYVVVMYAGRIVEKGTALEVFHTPKHPYTVGLLASKPVINRQVEELYTIPGSVPNPINMPDYCYFRDRCVRRTERCDGAYPHEKYLTDTHMVTCYNYKSTQAQD